MTKTSPRTVYVTHGDSYMKRVQRRELLAFLSAAISIAASTAAAFFTGGEGDPPWAPLFVVANLGLILALVHYKVLRRLGW